MWSAEEFSGLSALEQEPLERKTGSFVLHGWEPQEPSGGMENFAGMFNMGNEHVQLSHEQEQELLSFLDDTEDFERKGYGADRMPMTMTALDSACTEEPGLETSRSESANLNTSHFQTSASFGFDEASTPYDFYFDSNCVLPPKPPTAVHRTKHRLNGGFPGRMFTADRAHTEHDMKIGKKRSGALHGRRNGSFEVGLKNFLQEKPSSMDNLAEHLQGFDVHESSGKQCKCSVCGKAFARKYTLVQHLRIHTNERTHKCPVEGCGKDFVQKANLSQHMRYHTGEKPYVCDEPNCTAAYYQLANLKSHLKAKHGRDMPRKCRIRSCGRGFASAQELSEHLRLDHGRKC